MDKVFELIAKEKVRQQETIGLIPSENFASKAVMKAVGSVMMNKYSEGQPGKRYYQGNKFIDEVELLTKARALRVFGLNDSEWGVNVQVLSGTPANLAVYTALLEPGEKIMAMYLPDGGHLSHGWRYQGNKLTLVSKVWEVEFYKVNNDTRMFDYDEIEKQAKVYLPKMLISGGTAYPREIDHERMGQIAHSIGAYYLADIAHEAGLVAAGVNKSPFPYADVVTMTTHKTLRGPRGAMVFAKKLYEIPTTNHEIRDLAELVDRAVLPGIQGGPHNETIAGIGVCLGEVLDDGFSEYAKQVVTNAKVLAEELMTLGFDVVSKGTDKHLVLVDLRDKQLSGWTLSWALEVAGIVTNRNTVPGETASPFYPSGLRLGTPGVTTRGMCEQEMVKIARWIGEVCEIIKDYKLPEDVEERRVFTKQFLKDIWQIEGLVSIREQVKVLTDKFPIER